MYCITKKSEKTANFTGLSFTYQKQFTYYEKATHPKANIRF